MNIKEELKEAEQRAENIVREMKELTACMQRLSKEALKIDGEIRALKRLMARLIREKECLAG